MCNDVVGDQAHGHFHVLVTVERRFEVHVFDVGATKFGTGRAHDAIPHDFGGDHVGRPRGEFVGIIDEVAANGDADAVRVVFLRAMVDDNTGVGHRTVLRDAPDFVVREKKDSVSANCNTLFALGQAM